MERRQLARQRPAQDRAVTPEELAAAMMPAPGATPVLTRAEAAPDVGLDHLRPARALEAVAVGLREAPKPLPARRRQAPDTAWHHCLLYPLLSCPTVVGLTALLALLGTGFARALRAAPDRQADPAGFCLFWSACLVVGLLGWSCVCHYLEGALRGGMAGEAPFLLWHGRNVAAVLKSGLVWLFCFLAGPALAALGAFYYALYCGDPQVVDWLILTELVVLAVGYWVLALAAVSRRGRLRDVNPVRVAEVLSVLGYRGAAVALLASFVVFAHALAALLVGPELHRDLDFGLALLAAVCLSGLCWSAFVFRLLGVWCYRRL
jgi:hypothetical protein